MKTVRIILIVVLLSLGAWMFGLIPPYEIQAAPGDLTVTVIHGPLTATTIVMHLELKDDGVVVIDQSFSESYTQAIGLTVDVRNSIEKKMQEAIDAYRMLQVEKARAGYINATGIVANNLDLVKEL